MIYPFRFIRGVDLKGKIINNDIHLFTSLSKLKEDLLLLFFIGWVARGLFEISIWGPHDGGNPIIHPTRLGFMINALCFGGYDK